jgi:hypothetical protein
MSEEQKTQVQVQLIGGEFKWMKPTTEAKLSELAGELFADTGATAIILTLEGQTSDNTRKVFVAEPIVP